MFLFDVIFQVTDITETLCQFLKEHPHEIILLDFNHFYGMDLEHHIQLVTYLISQFDSLICHRCDTKNITLQRMWEKKKQVNKIC